MKKLEKYLFMVALMTLLATGVRGQFSVAWNTSYQHTHTPGYSNEGRRMAEDASGNLFMLADVVSDFDSTGNQANGNFHYATLSKYSSNGVLLNTIDLEIFGHMTSGPNNFSAFGLEVDASGDVYAGYTMWNSATDHDVHFVKLDNDLSSILWENSYAVSGPDMGIDFKLHANGTVYALIRSGSLSFTYSIIKSSPSNGSALQVLSFAPSIALKSLALSNGSTGYAAGSILKGNSKTAFVSSFDLNTGVVNWVSSYKPKGVSGNVELNRITVGIDNDIYSTGWADFGGATGIQPIVLKNSSTNPRLLFSLKLASRGVDDRGVLIDGSENGWLYIGIVSLSGNNILLFRIPSSGAFTNPATIGYAPVPSGQYNAVTGIKLASMRISSSKNVYMTGSIDATGNSGSFTCAYLLKASVVFGAVLVDAGSMPVEGDYNANVEGVDLALDYNKVDVYWLRNSWDDSHSIEKVEIVDVNAPSPLRLGVSSSAPVRLSPNPASSFARIQASETILNLEILDATGRMVFESEIGESNYLLSLVDFDPGIYFCRVLTTSGVTDKKLIIQ